MENKELADFAELIINSQKIEDNEIKEIVNDFIANKYDDFYLLVNMQNDYYTIFQMIAKNGEYDSLASAVSGCLASYGDIKYANIEDSTITFITCAPDVDAINIFYFMPFDEGIVTVNK